jgi:uncharacterized protein
MIYLDTSVLVPLFVAEPQSAAVRTWFTANAAQPMAVSNWALVEFASALGVKVRRKDLHAREALRACKLLRELVEASMRIIAPMESTYEQAAGLVGHFASGLRAGDALHLAVAMDAEVAGLYTLDERLIATSRKLRVGFQVASPI